MFEKFEDYYARINESQRIDEAFRSPLLATIAASSDKATKDFIKSMVKKDGIALSEVPEEDVYEFFAWEYAKDVKDVLKKGKKSIAHQNDYAGTRRVIGFSKKENKILVSGIYENGDLTFDYCIDPKVKSWNKFFTVFSDIFDKGSRSEVQKDFQFVAISVYDKSKVASIKKSTSDKELEHVWKRESAALKSKLIAEDTKLKSDFLDIIKKITGTKADLSTSRVHLRSVQLQVTGKFGHDIDIYFKDNSQKWGRDIQPNTSVEDVVIEIGGGSMGAQDPKKEPDYFERYRIMGVLGNAIIANTKEVQDLIAIQIKLAQNERMFDEFTFEMNGKKYRKLRGSGGFEELETE